MNADSGPQIRRIRLLTLGALDLEAQDGTKVQSVLQQPKRLAVLLYLALARPHGFQRRDRLVGLFWPEQDQEKARKALNQAIHFLRRSLGKDAIESRGDEELGLGEAYVWCDVLACERALEEGRLAEGLSLYQGELLSGFYVPEAPAFEQWLEDERRRLRDRAYKAALALTDSADKAGDRAAADWARRALEIAPHEEAALRRLIQILVAQRDRAGAVRAYDEFARRLMQDYELEPSADTQRLIASVKLSDDPAAAPSQAAVLHQPGTPFDLGRPISTPDVSPAREPLPLSLPRQSATKPFWRRQWSIPVAAALVVAVSTVVLPFVKPTPEPVTVVEPGPLSNIAVLFFDDNSRDGTLGYLANGITDALITELSSVEALSVISKNGVRPFRSVNLPLDSIARMLHVGTMVGGSIERSGNEMRIRVELIDAASGRSVENKSITRPFGDDFAAVDEVVREVAASLRVRLGKELQLRKWQAGTDNMQAWKLMREADDLRDRAEVAKRTGDVAASEAARRSAEQMLLQAERLAPRWTEPLVIRSRIAESRAFEALRSGGGAHTKLFDDALTIAERAVALNGRDPASLEQMAFLLFFRTEFAPPDRKSTGNELARAQDALELAVEIEPNRARAWNQLSMILESRGQFSQAKLAAERAHKADAYLRESLAVLARLFTTSFELGEDAQAKRWCEEIGKRFPHGVAHAMCVLHLMAWGENVKFGPTEAWSTVNDIRADPPQIQTAMRPRLIMLAAAVLARADQIDSARSVIRSTAASSVGDPERGFFQAIALTATGDHQEAIRVLGAWIQENPGSRSSLLLGRRFKALRRYHDFNVLTAQSPARSPD